MHAMTPEVRRIILSVMEGLSCPRAVTVAILVRYEQWDELTSLKCIPKHYSSAISYADAVQATDLLRKCVDLDFGFDVEAATLKQWWWAEKECYKTNERLAPYLFVEEEYTPPDCDPAIASFVRRLRKNVKSIVGNGPSRDLHPGFGPGATMSDPARMALVPDKLDSTITMTPSSWTFLGSFKETAWRRFGGWKDIVAVRGNTYFTVNKTARIKRACATGPSFNLFWQKAFGRNLKSRLLRAGIDLRKGKDLHQDLARRASLTGEYATVDVTSASDTQAYNLVKLSFPSSWFEPLDALREPMTQVNGAWVRLEKFSAMGNGYTFEVETILFLAICMTAMGEFAVPGHNVWVYGDDMIVPTESASEVIAALKFFGFTPNESKTFVEGPFRESCGGDFWLGERVRPHLIEELPYEPQHYISLANGIRRMAFKNCHSAIRWTLLVHSWHACLALLPSAIRQCRGPEELGDIVIHDDPEHWRSCKTKWSRRYFKCYRPVNRVTAWEGWSYDTQFASALYGVVRTRDRNPVFHYQKDSCPHGAGLIGRDSVIGHTFGWVTFS